MQRLKKLAEHQESLAAFCRQAKGSNHRHRERLKAMAKNHELNAAVLRKAYGDWNLDDTKRKRGGSYRK